MPGACIRTVLDGAREILDGWINVTPRLCDLMRAVFPGYPYQKPHFRAYYQLRYFPAYFYENYLLFTRLQQLGLEQPQVASIGCGCLVDAAAALDVYADVNYRGYDVNDWEIKAVGLNDAIGFSRVDVFNENSFPQDINVFIFPRSIRDMDEDFDQFINIMQRTNLQENRVYVCGSYQVGAAGIDRARVLLQTFAGLIEGYKINDQQRVLYAPRVEGLDNEGIGRGCPWLCGLEGDSEYLVTLPWRCRDVPDNCIPERCRLRENRMMLKTHNLAFEIIPLDRVP